MGYDELKGVFSASDCSLTDGRTTVTLQLDLPCSVFNLLSML